MRVSLHLRNGFGGGVTYALVSAETPFSPFLFERLVGGVAEWSCSGLQSRVRRFDSDPRLQFCCPGGVIGSRWGLKIPWPQGRAGSTPAPGTNALERAVLSYSGATGGKERDGSDRTHILGPDDVTTQDVGYRLFVA